MSSGGDIIRKRIVLVTGCGKKKEDKPQVAGLLYKSSRIRHLYRRSKELGIPFYILSAKYGLVDSNDVIEPYDQIMTKERINELKSQVSGILRNFDVVIFFKGGVRKEYRTLIEMVCDELGIELIEFGYGNMGDIRKLDEILKSVIEDRE
jgi:diphthamide synthase (EF-2-diphthine--ammonia ligase)